MKNENPELLRVENASKHFGGLAAVSEASLSVRQGEIIGLIGPNGAGKTTLFNMISGALTPNNGKIHFDGHDITHLTMDRICKLGLGRTYQIVQPFENLSVLENVMVGAFIHAGSVQAARRKAEEVLEFVGLADKASVRGPGLSLQHLKRMEVARALATNPKLILLDEVMAGLNPTATEQVIQMILKIREAGVTVLIIEHIMKAVMTLSDRIYVLSQGNMIATGEPIDIVKNPEVIKSYLGEKKYA